MEELIKKFKKFATKQLLSKAESLVGKELEAILVVLESRGQDVSKYEVSEPLEKIEASEEIKTVDMIYEAEPEEPLSKEDESLIKKAEKEDEKESLEVSSLANKCEKYIKTFKETSDGFIKITAILRGRGIKKLSPFELRMILAVPSESKSKPEVKDLEEKSKVKEPKPDTKKSKPEVKEDIVDDFEVIPNGTKVKVIKNDNSEVIGEIVKLNHNDKGVAFYSIKVDKKTMCRIPKFVSKI